MGAIKNNHDAAMGSKQNNAKMEGRKEVVEGNGARQYNLSVSSGHEKVTTGQLASVPLNRNRPREAPSDTRRSNWLNLPQKNELLSQNAVGMRV